MRALPPSVLRRSRGTLQSSPGRSATCRPLLLQVRHAQMPRGGGRSILSTSALLYAPLISSSHPDHQHCNAEPMGLPRTMPGVMLGGENDPAPTIIASLQAKGRRARGQCPSCSSARPQSRQPSQSTSISSIEYLPRAALAATAQFRCKNDDDCMPSRFS